MQAAILMDQQGAHDEPDPRFDPADEGGLDEAEADRETLVALGEIVEVPAKLDERRGRCRSCQIGLEDQRAFRQVRLANLPGERAGRKLRVREHAVAELAESLP